MSFLPKFGNPQRRPPYAHQNSDVELLSTAPTEDTVYSNPARPSITVSRIRFSDQGAHLSPTGWPVNPRPLSKTALYKISVGLWDGFLALSPLLFIAMGALAANLDRKPLSDWGDTVQRATLLGPTIFPIMFAGLVGSTLKTIARFRAERGARLGLLEQLMGSHTLLSTVETHYFLRSFGPLGISLILLWALSPLGGQASLRLLGTTHDPHLSLADLRYLSTNQTTFFNISYGVYTMGFAMNAIYTAALLAPNSARQSSMDTWGNVRIPIYERLDDRPASGNPWVHVSNDTAYSSLLGLPVVGLPDSDLVYFTLESTYFNIECQSLEYVKTSDVGTTITDTLVHEAGNYSDLFTESFFLDTTTPWANFTDSTTNASHPRNIIFGSSVDISGFSLARLTITSTRVESQVVCHHSQCAVDRMRRSETDRRAATSTPFDSLIVSTNMFQAFTTAVGKGRPTGATATEQFINNPSTLYGVDLVELYKLPKDVFTERLALAFNTYYQAGLVPTYQLGAFPTNISVYDLGYDGPGESSPFQNNAATASVTNYQRVYVSSRSWLAIMMICSLILQFCAIAGLVLKHRLRGPDILGFVSSMTRDNQYTPLRPGGSTLDGLERARLLRNVPVRLEDVNWSKEVGHIALTFTDGEAGSATRLRKHKPYL